MIKIFILFILFSINCSVLNENQKLHNKCSNNYIFPFILGRPLNEIRGEEMFKGKIPGSEIDRFIIFKKVESRGLVALDISALSDKLMFHGYILTGRNQILLGYKLMVQVTDRDFLKNFYDRLGNPAIDLKDQAAPKEFKELDEITPKKWTYKKWDLKNCNSTLIIQEMPLNNPVYDCFTISSFYNEFSKFFKYIGWKFVLINS